jgi:hypothetical protein
MKTAMASETGAAEGTEIQPSLIEISENGRISDNRDGDSPMSIGARNGSTTS